MRRVTYEDEKGRKYLAIVDDEIPDDQAYLGIPVGPPDVVDVLGLPEPFATRLHNILFDRELFSLADVQRQRGALQGALQAALRVDIQLLHNAYVEISKGTG